MPLAAKGAGAKEATPPTLGRPPSCLSGLSHRDRADARGNTIMKGSKGHKVTFKDEIQPDAPVADVQEVTSFKNSPQGCCTIS
mmetsp:Transcript_92921/g.184457  ORF Transcript_92921/g.184457 Transcript_92921/m.184457 type:complete len:83 (-) Transcript_92921:276-524(-)